MIAPPSLEYPAVEDALELGALRKALQRARKGLLIAVADQPVLREAIRLWLSRVLDRPLEVRTLEEDRPLLEQIREADQAAEPEAILWLEGLERLPLSAIEALNRQRAGLSRLRHPLLLWTPTFRLRELMEHAPDLFDWHSGFYEFKAARTFAPEQALRWIELQMPSALSPQERRRRISLLEELRAEYSGSEEALPALATVLFQLGRLYAEGGFNLDLALERYREALACYERLGDLRGKGDTLRGMASILRLRGDLDGAMRLYQEALEIAERLGDLRGKGATLREMASILRLRGDLDGAMRLYQQSLEIDERLGDLRGKGATLHEMAYILRLRGDLDGAMRLYQEALEIAERLGDLRGKAATLHEMAYILRLRGDLDGAMRLYQEALEIDERLGDLRGKGATLREMAYILRLRGDLDGAMRLYQEALELAERLGDLQGQSRDAGDDGAGACAAQGKRGEAIASLLAPGWNCCCKAWAKSSRCRGRPKQWPAILARLASASWAPRPSTACGARSSGRSRRPGRSPRPLERLSAIP
jgi:tetratricopeptide (TPR) repeat protein